MTTETFWNIIDATKRTGRRERLEALRDEIRKLSAAEIAGFDHEFDRQMRHSFTWDLWGAAYVINGGCSDDGFDYFRSWLISLGRRTFQQALADPDSMADETEVLRAREDDEGVQFEKFAYVAQLVHEEKTGQPIPSDPAGVPPDQEPAGEPWSETGDDLRKRFPRLWAKFGASEEKESRPVGVERKKGCLTILSVITGSLLALALGLVL